MFSIFLQIVLVCGTFQKVDIQDMVLLSPLKIQSHGSQVFVLDWRLPGMLLLDDATYKKRIGQKGKGPSDFYFLKSFSVNSDGMFVLNDIHAEIKQFDLDGTFKRRIQTDMDQTESAYANDIMVVDTFIYMSFGKAKIPLKMFDSTGKQRKEWPIPLKAYPSNIGHSLDLFTIKEDVFLFNRFDGTLFQLDQKAEMVRLIDEVKIPGFGLTLEKEIKSANERQEKNQNQLVSTSYFLPLIETKDGLKAITSDPIKDGGLVHQAYDFNSKEVSKVDFNGLPSTPVCIKAIAAKTFVIDYDGDLYIKNGAL